MRNAPEYPRTATTSRAVRRDPLVLGRGLVVLLAALFVASCATVNETAKVTRNGVEVDWSRRVSHGFGGKSDNIAQERSGKIEYEDPETGKLVKITFYSGQDIAGMNTPDTGAQVLKGIETGGALVLEGYKSGNERRLWEDMNPQPSNIERILGSLAPGEREALLGYFMGGGIGTP